MLLQQKEAEIAAIYREHAESLLELPYSGARDRPVFGDGALDATLLLIGEAPGAQETEMGKPFVGKAGKQLDAFLETISLDRSALYVTNAVKYRPIKPGTRANRTPNTKEIAFGRALLLREIAIVAPRIVVTLGNTPLYAVTGDRTIRIGDCHGGFLPVPNEAFAVFPLYHPASVIYNPTLRSIYETDMRNLSQVVEAMRKVQNP